MKATPEDKTDISEEEQEGSQLTEVTKRKSGNQMKDPIHQCRSKQEKGIVTPIATTWSTMKR